jgi:hypothetical protein
MNGRIGAGSGHSPSWSKGQRQQQLGEDAVAMNLRVGDEQRVMEAITEVSAWQWGRSLTARAAIWASTG